MLFLGDAYTKTGRPVIKVLEEKHPAMHIQDLTYPECSSFEKYKQDPDVVHLQISEEDLQWVATHITGAARPSGMDAMAFQRWILQLGISLASLR